MGSALNIQKLRIEVVFDLGRSIQRVVVSDFLCVNRVHV